ncbi:hypothetical protein Cfla_2896 [Cellulomonas flavigena DSM 20109]|uniref:Periplasmic copper-binding protein NosD beta helix domain-containing protein n=1 Tax=Cellulomonas flavigena (strain ATCC 482 / DSM 20109 / BCRC 11376 / JCM 18109 / NBRC 3775 / NCIMB 8073 / NRS 134) TaxID=446466 RepID=D5UKB8_CELFN|nr:right-handed parallel beta-helix repeat-containing protein [Cellulomonas flavigena]ADG75779.1 hypothetical protein Cfla_2896 [Cellulomonas flavigena DSM 20109]
MRVRSAVVRSALDVGSASLAAPPGRRRRRGLQTLTAAAAALVLGAGGSALAAPAAAAPVVGCGAVVEGEVTLGADLVCRNSPVGLTLLDGASLDLAGHRVVGGGSGTGLIVPPGGSATVHGGVVRGWESGVALAEDAWDAPGRLVIEDVTFRENTTGLELQGLGTVAPDTDVTASRFVANGTGISALDLWGGVDLTVSASRFTDNATALDVTSSTVAVADSVLAYNEQGVACDQSACRIEDSTLRDNGTAVSSIWYGTARVYRSTFVRNDIGVDSYWVLSIPNELVGNTFTANGTGVRFDSAHGVLTDNTFVRNDVGYEGRSEDGPPYFTAALVGNDFRRNGDGILSVVGESTLQANTAVANERWGIHAPGAVDLGGNTARGNGNEPQCVGVVCEGAGPAS